MLDNHPRTQLCFIIEKYGRSVIDDPRRCRGMLKDLAPQHQRETNLLMLALEQRIVTELVQKNTLIPLPLQLEHLAQRLHENVGIQKEFAAWTVESWALALDVIQQPVPKQTAQSIPKTSPQLKVAMPSRLLPTKIIPSTSTPDQKQNSQKIVKLLDVAARERLHNEKQGLNNAGIIWLVHQIIKLQDNMCNNLLTTIIHCVPVQLLFSPVNKSKF